MYKDPPTGPWHAAAFIKYSLLLLCAGVMFYTVTVDSELENTELLLLAEIQG